MVILKSGSPMNDFNSIFFKNDFMKGNSARMAELVDALVSNTCGKPCRFDSGSGYLKASLQRGAFFYGMGSNFFKFSGSGYLKASLQSGAFSKGCVL